ncbi:SDR family NAD(P)-dependent oxidoreductase [Streptomyces sp. C11-1]|uniref:SDR family NAD(P)-dependent oxidoreductase n=1 Tax=Streptomyces durocortorensis TaxID=2811104 RepID=A0ABY9W6W7_9ACTN|nr:SDR family NAD(P)-dependent oxidoreductase [Streptomyces durocortorensis]WNF30952.1 SDR family NAD(P)-dependent oxidoreductase [Streptomyces durocortorensis]
MVVSGGTSGIGEALAHTYLKRGDRVAVIGPNPDKGKSFLAAAADLGAEERAFFIRADLSLVSENERVVQEIEERFPVVDALVLCARFFRSYRRVTSEGFEHNFALYYLSRFLLGYGLVGLLEKAPSPVIMNVAGPGVDAGGIHWNDLGFEHGYDGWAAMFQGGKLNDLLGASFAAEHRGYRTRYVLNFPGGTATGFAGEFDPATAARIQEMLRYANPVEVGIAPIVAAIDAPPAEPLSAFFEGRRLSTRLPSFDQQEALRLDALTRELLAR